MPDVPRRSWRCQRLGGSRGHDYSHALMSPSPPSGLELSEAHRRCQVVSLSLLTFFKLIRRRGVSGFHVTLNSCMSSYLAAQLYEYDNHVFHSAGSVWMLKSGHVHICIAQVHDCVCRM